MTAIFSNPDNIFSEEGSCPLPFPFVFSFTTGAATKTKDKVESRLLDNVVVIKGATILELLVCKDQALLVSRDAFLFGNLELDVLDGSTAVAGLEG
jgi:hypothetical protein